MGTTTKSRKQTEITAATVNRIVSKATGQCLGYLVKSDSSDQYYQVTFNEKSARYECSCPATKPCKHERAVREVVKARKELQAEREAAKEDSQAFAEEVLMRLETASQEMDTATDEESYESAKSIFVALKGDLIEMGYPPMMTVRGWAINKESPTRYCGICQCAAPLQAMPNGMRVCAVCAENRPVKIAA